MLNKILIIFLSLLLFAMVFELGYFYFQTNTPVKQKLKPVETTKGNTLPNGMHQREKIEYNRTLPGRYFLKKLQTANPGLLVSSLLKNQYKGIVAKILAQNGTLSTPSIFAYKFQLDLDVGEKSSNSSLPGDYYRFYFNENDMSRLTVVKLINNKETSVGLTDLKIGDVVTIDQTLDLTKDLADNMVELKITKN